MKILRWALAILLPITLFAPAPLLLFYSDEPLQPGEIRAFAYAVILLLAIIGFCLLLIRNAIVTNNALLLKVNLGMKNFVASLKSIVLDMGTAARMINQADKLMEQSINAINDTIVKVFGRK